MTTETLRTKEEIKETDRIYVFDLDGVVTNPENNEVSVEVLSHVVDDLKRGQAVAFNTGRGHFWVTEHILPHLQQECTAQELKNLLIVAEMGGVVCKFEDDGLQIELDSTLSLPGEFVQDAQQLLETEVGDDHRLSDYMFWDGNKHTMGSVEKWAHTSLTDFTRVRPVLVNGLRNILGQHEVHDFIIGQTTIATDIQHHAAGKHKGADQVLAWLKEKRLQPQAFYTFGDSVSDKAMAETFAGTGTKTTFIFVGNPEKGSEVQSDAYETVVMEGGHSTDTALYLSKLG